MMEDFAVALILIAISIILILAIGLVCRAFGVWRFSSLWASKEEKSVLTKSEKPVQGYMYSDDSLKKSYGDDVHEQEGGILNKQISTDAPSYDIEHERVSPVSVDSMSVASDYEPQGGLHRAMSCDSVTSDTSVMEIEPEAPKIGQLEFGLEYDKEVCELVVSVIQARDLDANENTGTLDSYVKLWLTPLKSGKCSTKVFKDSIHPQYAERFLFNVAPEQLDAQTVQFQIYSSDKYARHKLLGETDLRIGDIDLRQPIRVWMNLRDMDEKPTDLGDVMFSLSYLPTAERLTVVIVKARSIKWNSGKEYGDCFVRVYLLQNGKKISKKKTSLKRDVKNPIFNESMIFSVPTSVLANVQLRIIVTELKPGGDISSVGHVIVGSQLSGTELSHWNQMMSSLRKPVAMWHSLKGKEKHTKKHD